MKDGKLRRVAIILLSIMLLNSMVVLADISTNDKELVNEQVEPVNDDKEEIKDENEEVNAEEEVNTEEETVPEVKPEEEDTDEANIKLNVRYRLDGEKGKPEDLPNDIEKEYMKAITDGDVLIKSLLKFDENPKVKLDFASEDYKYTTTKIKIGNLTVTRDEYNTKKLNELTEDFDIFKGISEIEVYVSAEDLTKVKTVDIKVQGFDAYHKDSAGNIKNVGTQATKFDISYTVTAPTVAITHNLLDNDKIIFKNNINTDEKTITFDGYEIESIELVNNTDALYEYKANLKPKELDFSDGSYKLGDFIFKNKYNGEDLTNYLRKDTTDYFIVNSTKGEKTPENILDGQVADLNITNRTTGLLADKVYVGDEITIDIKDADKLVKKALGNDYEFENFLSGVTANKIVISDAKRPGSKEIANFDYERVNYKVKINDEDEKIFTVMKKDTSEIKFDSEKIKSVKINGQGNELKGKAIVLKDLGENDIIYITTEEKLETFEYKVQNKVFGTEEKLHQPRIFQGIEGLTLVVNPIKQHNYKDGKEVVIRKNNQDYKLADEDRKEIVIKKDMETSFYFTPKDKIRYKAIYITRYDGSWHSSSDTNYAIEMKKDDKYRLLHETEVFIDDSGKPINLGPKLFNDGNLELIRLDSPIERDMTIEGYEGIKFDGYDYIQYVSDGVAKVPAKDTIFVFSYKQKANRPSDLVKFKVKETVDENRTKPSYQGGGDNVVDLEYPRYKDDYTVELTLDKARFSCKGELRLFINDDENPITDFGLVNQENPIKIVDGAYITKIVGDKETSGNLVFTILIKGTGDDDGDLFPRLEKRSAPKEFNNYTDLTKFSMENLEGENNGFKGIELNYIGSKGDACGPIPPLVQSEVTLIKSVLKEGKPDPISGDWNKTVIKTLSGSKIDLNVLEKTNGIPQKGKYKKNITRDIDNNSYVYEPIRDKKFIGVVDKDGANIDIEDKILGEDTDILIIKGKEPSRIYLNYKKETPEEIDKTKFKFRTSYYYISMPNELISDFGVKPNIKDQEQAKYIEDLKKEIEAYYADSYRDEKLENAKNKIKAYYSLNNEKADIQKELEELKTRANKLTVTKYKEELVALIQSLIDLNGQAIDVSGNVSISLEEVNKSIDKLDETLVDYLKSKGYAVQKSAAKVNDVVRENNKHYVKYYEGVKARDNGVVYNKTHPYSETHNYREIRRNDYTFLPLSISNNIYDFDSIMTKFIKFGDYQDGFYLRDIASEVQNPNWKKTIETKGENLAEVNYGYEVNNDIPVIFLERVSNMWDLEKKPDKPEPPEKTEKNLDIIYRFFDKNGNLIKEYPPIEYKDLPSYINRLGWRINDFKQDGFNYMDNGQGLKEGDVKYSDILKNGKTVKLYLDYKGEGKVPPIVTDKYGYTIFHQEIDLDNLSALPKPIETFISNDKYPVGTVLSIKPTNREADGYVLINDANQITNDYSSKNIEIKDEKKYGSAANYHFYRYAKLKDPEIKNVYKVEYTDENYNELTDSKLVKLDTNVKNYTENAKYIDSYKARIQSIELKLEKIEGIENIIHFVEKAGYTVVKEDGKYKFVKDKIVFAEIFKKSGENTLRFIYDRDLTPKKAEIVYDANDGNFGDGTTINRVNGEIGKKVSDHSPSKTARRSGYSFVRWTYDRNGSERLDNRVVKNGDYIVLYAQWSKDSDGGGDKTKPKDPDKDRDKGKVIEPKIEYELNKKDHFAYIKGYPDITVQPNGYITREEVAMVFYRLMEQEYRKEIETTNYNFTDVKPNTWSTKAIATLSNGGLLKGYPDGSFKPHGNMTRAEISKVIARFTDTKVLETEMTDIIGHWAEDYINTAQKEGWITGYGDGTFKPDKLLTRAEFVTMVNSLLDRKVKKENALPGLKQFKDLEENKWYYEQMIEAINGHLYEDKRLPDGSEKWTKLVDTQFPD